MLRPSPYEITQLLRDWRGGSHQAQEELWPVIYRELKGLRASGAASMKAAAASLRQTAAELEKPPGA